MYYNGVYTFHLFIVEMSWIRRVDVGSAFQFAVFQSELFGHFPPGLRVEEVVRPPFVVRCLFHEGHSGYLRYPHFFFHVITPLPTIPANEIAS